MSRWDDSYTLGYLGACYDEPRSWAENIGANTICGWDAYWTEHGPNEDDSIVKVESPFTPGSYWQNLTNKQLIEGYIQPHIAKANDEGMHVRSLMLQECERRLNCLD